MRVALDALGGDHAPHVIVQGALQSLVSHPALTVVLVGRTDELTQLVEASGGIPDRLEIVHAAEGVPMDADPVAAVRARRGTSIRVAAELLKRGDVQATVSAGQTAAALAAATFVVGRLRGITRPALAVVLPSLAGPVVLLDAGAGTGLSADLLAQHALAGSCYAEALGIAEPRVGLLTVGGESGKGDEARREAHGLLAALPVNYIGPVEGHDLAIGGPADVIVTDGFTGNVALKALEGAVAWSARRLGERYGDPGPARALVKETAHSSFAGGMLVGVNGVSVVAHGAADGPAVAAAIDLAVLAVRRDLVTHTATLLAELIATRRRSLGLGELT
ncbi:MAG: phosphate acyltransferase PlsX [Actinobacteria bacterium]|nr:phosphate acyltransferase PlsX [Actinomycetota bacterium]